MPTVWSDGDTQGWDECFPNISPGQDPISGRALSDHGELWNQTPLVRVATNSYFTRWTNISRVDFERNIRLTGSEIVVEYSLINRGDAPASVAWAMHLLLAASPSAVVLDGETPIRVDSSSGVFTAPRGESVWEDVASQMPSDEEVWSAKLFTASGTTSQVSVRYGHEYFTIQFAEGARRGCFGLWLNAGGFEGRQELRHIGVEPSFGDYDDLAAARAHGTELVIDAEDAVTFGVTLSACAQIQGAQS